MNGFKNELLVWHAFTINGTLIIYMMCVHVVELVVCIVREKYVRRVYWIFQWENHVEPESDA